jgi:hypothetical protein
MEYNKCEIRFLNFMTADLYENLMLNYPPSLVQIKQWIGSCHGGGCHLVGYNGAWYGESRRNISAPSSVSSKPIKSPA